MIEATMSDLTPKRSPAEALYADIRNSQHRLSDRHAWALAERYL